MMKIGKLPVGLLEELLSSINFSDSRVMLGPRIGEDAALIDFGNRVVAAKTDPITFATDLIGWYAVQINANDVACVGAKPLWFLATILLPESVNKRGVRSIFNQILDACSSMGIALIGGHTEITRGLSQPIVVGCMLGEVEKGKEISTAGANIGDSIVITKGIALEGSAIIARDHHQALTKLGLDQTITERAAQLLFNPGISVVKDALTACSAVTVHSLHDPTEGGLATSLREVASAAGVGLLVNQDKIPILPECSILCDTLNLDPLGLLSSGCLIITLRQTEVSKLLASLQKEGIHAQEIGLITPPEDGILIKTGDSVNPLPKFTRDELARYLES